MIIPGGSDQFGKGARRRYPVVYMDEYKGDDRKGEVIAQGIKQIGNTAAEIMFDIHQKKEEKLLKAQEAEEKSRLETNIIGFKGRMSDTARSVYDDPDIPSEKKFDEFNKRAEEGRDDFFNSFPEDKRHAAEPIYAEAIMRAKGFFYDKHSERLKEEAMANTEATIETLERQAAVSPGERQKSIALLSELEMPGVSAKGRQKIINEFVERTADTEIVNRINGGELKDLLDDLKGKDKKGRHTYLQGMDPKTRQHYIGSVKAEIDRLKNAAETKAKNEHAQWERDVKQILTNYEDAKVAGFNIPIDEETKLFRMVKGTDYEKQYQEIKKKAEDPFYKAKKIAEDPLTFGAAQLGIEIEPLNMSNPDNLLPQMQERLEIGRRIKKAYNIPYTPVLATEEVKGLTAMLQTQDAGSIETIGLFKKMLGKEAVTGIARQISVEDPEAGMVIGYTLKGKIKLATGITKGQKILKEKAMTLPPDDMLRGEYEGLVGDGLSGLPIISNTHYKAFKAYYAALAARDGIENESVKGSIAEEAFRAVVGETTTINGKDVVLPDGVNEDSFTNKIRSLGPLAIEHMGGVYGYDNEEAAELLREDAQFYVTSRPGVYRAALDGKFLMNREGTKLIEFHFMPDAGTKHLVSEGKVE